MLSAVDSVDENSVLSAVDSSVDEVSYQQNTGACVKQSAISSKWECV